MYEKISEIFKLVDELNEKLNKSNKHVSISYFGPYKMLDIDFFNDSEGIIYNSYKIIMKNEVEMDKIENCIKSLKEDINNIL